MKLALTGKLNLGQEHITVTKRNLLNPDEILRLDHNKEIVILRGKPPCIIDKFIYIKHPLARNLKETLLTDYKKETFPIKQEKAEKSPIKVETKEIQRKNKKNGFDGF